MPKAAHIVLGAPADDAVFPEPLKADIVIGVDRGAFECLSRDIPVTIAVGDFDSVSIKEKADLRSSSVSFYDYHPEKDDTDAEIALVIALNEESVKDIFIYNWSGGRLDHMLSLLYMVYQPRFAEAIDRITLYDKLNTITFYRPGDYTLIKEERRQYLSFIGMTPIEELTLLNVKYPLDRASYPFPRALISNEFIAEACCFSFSEGLLAVIQSGDN